jgi:DNA-binding NarL/FixJ family response regulator
VPDLTGPDPAVGERLRVVVADDHAPMIAGVRMALLDSGFEVCAEADNAHDAVREARAHRPDVVLLDIHMPGNGLSAARTISDELPDTAVVMLTVSQSEADLFEALRAGARGYLLKHIDPVRLPEALRGVLNGEVALPRTMAARLVDEFRRRESGPRRRLLGKRQVRLSEREWETLELLQQGLSTKEIAERFFVTPATVRSHVSALLRKLDVNTRDQAVAMVRGRE